MPQVTAILPTYGHPELTLSAIARLREQSAPPAAIIVVDDGAATPFTPPPGVYLLRHDTNRGFAAAVNTGVRAARTELVAILNNDVTLAPDWLERLASVISSQTVDFACGKLYRPDGLIDGTFDLLCRGGLAWRAGNGRPDGPLWSTPQRILFTSYTAVMAKREAVALDETYHSYYEDVEWSLRAAIDNKIGYFDPSATGVHTGSATAGAWSAYSTRQLLRNHRRLAHQYLLPEYQREYRIASTLLRAHCLNHGQWPDVPAEPIPAKAVDRTRLAELLTASENQLRQLQADSTPDRLWRWYFRLTI
jgi:GT2 family glycosyltransferase